MNLANFRIVQIFGFTLLACLSCASVPKTTFQDRGLHYEITEDFRIGRSDFYKKNHSTYTPIYSRDENVYAKLSIIWLPGACDLDWGLGNYTDALTSLYKKSEPEKVPEYSAYKSVLFGGREARRVDYIVPNDGPRVGSYTVFHCDSISVIIGVHSVVEGKVKIDQCLARIEKTLRCTHAGNNVK